MCGVTVGILAIILAQLCHSNAMFNSQPQFTMKAENNKAFNESCLIGTFEITNGNIADCLEHCLENCSCQSFQICQNTQCQLCSSHKEDNSSLLRDKDDCVYAMYEMQHLAEGFQRMNDQCSGMSCLLKYNCCQQSGLCPKNKICRPLNSFRQPWKRYICDCPDGYYGNNCDKPIKSCRGYSNGFHKSGRYTIFDDSNYPKMYEVYCHFDSDGAWTLVQSYSYENYKASKTKRFAGFRKPLFKNFPANENTPSWSDYRLSEARMKSIQKDSSLLRFTCDYEKGHDAKSDYVVIPLRQYSATERNELTIDVGDFRQSLGDSVYFFAHYGKIRGIQLDHCNISLYQNYHSALHMKIVVTNASCKLALPTGTKLGCEWHHFNYFGKYRSYCLDKEHSCVKDLSSTTQLWFGR